MKAFPPPVALVVRPVEPLAELLQGGAERAQSYAADARASNTRRTYASQWKAFTAWCAARALSPLPAAGEAVAIYLAELADTGRKARTIAVALSAISQAHQLAGEPSPRAHRAVKETWKGIRRRLGMAEAGKAPLYGSELLRALDTLPPTLTGLRDRALLLLGYTGAFRRSELVALVIEDLRELAAGLEVTIRRSKTDQEGLGRSVPIPRERVPEVCPVRAVKAWIEAAGLTEGPLFRAIDRHGRLSPRGLAPSGHHVALLVKRVTKAAGLDPMALSGHSLRAGLVTAAALDGRSFPAIKTVTGHKSDAMVAKYIRRAELFQDSAAGGLLSHAALRPPRGT